MNTYVYILTMGLVTLAIRIIPLTLLRRQIKNRFLQSFLYYVPYATLAVMTFPAILHATQSTLSGAAALLVGTVSAWFGFDLFKVAVSCCSIVLILEFFLV